MKDVGCSEMLSGLTKPACSCACTRVCVNRKKSLNADAVFGVIVKSEDECSINRGFRSRGPPQSSHLFLQRFLPGGGHLRRWHALTGASFQQVNPGWARALLVLKVEEHILVKREELLVPAAVLRRLLAQEAAPGALFTRDHRQEQRVPFVVTDALLHFAVGSERKWANLVGGWGGRGFSPRAHGGRWLRFKLFHRETHEKVAPPTGARPRRNSWRRDPISTHAITKKPC